MTSTRRSIAAAALLAGLVLGGCSAQPGAAAVVNGERISENELDRALIDFAAVTGQEVEPAAMLGTLVVAPVILQAAADHGVAASDDEAAELLDRQAELAGLTPPESYGHGVLQVAKMTVVNQDMAASPAGAEAIQAVNEGIAQAEIEVSPRYGEFDATTGQVLPQQLPWIETPETALPGLPGQ